MPNAASQGDLHKCTMGTPPVASKASRTVKACGKSMSTIADIIFVSNIGNCSPCVAPIPSPVPPTKPCAPPVFSPPPPKATVLVESIPIYAYDAPIMCMRTGVIKAQSPGQPSVII